MRAQRPGRPGSQAGRAPGVSPGDGDSMRPDRLMALLMLLAISACAGAAQPPAPPPAGQSPAATSAAAAGAAAPAPAAPTELTHLTMAYTTASAANSPLRLAQDRGIF